MPLRPLDPARCARPVRVLWVVALALSLLVAQALGLAHRIAHAMPASMAAPGPAAEVVAQNAALDEARASSSPGWLHALFAGHEGGQCRLYDAHGLGSPVPLLLSLPAVVPVVVAVHFIASDCPWGSATGLHARGPPARA